MDKYGKIENNVVVGTIEMHTFVAPVGEEADWEVIPDHVENGWETDAGRTTWHDTALQWAAVEAKQQEMIAGVRNRIERHMTQRDLGMADIDMADNAAMYLLLLQYVQDIRDNDETTHATPADANTALDALVVPV